MLFKNSVHVLSLKNWHTDNTDSIDFHGFFLFATDAPIFDGFFLFFLFVFVVFVL